MGNSNSGELLVEDFMEQIEQKCGKFKHEQDKQLFEYAWKVVAEEKGSMTRAIIYFNDPELGAITVGVDKKEAKSVVVFRTNNGMPQHAWEKRKNGNKKAESERVLPALGAFALGLTEAVANILSAIRTIEQL